MLYIFAVKDEFENHTLPCNVVCTTLADGEHCDGKDGLCKCGNGLSCIDTDLPFCDKGECKGNTYAAKLLITLPILLVLASIANV